jgi:hypothetical protein
MSRPRQNADLWEKLVAAGVASGAGPTALFEIQGDAEARIQHWRALIRAAEEEADRPPGDPRPRRFADASREADRAREALADALELRRWIEERLSRRPRRARGRT